MITKWVDGFRPRNDPIEKFLALNMYLVNIRAIPFSARLEANIMCAQSYAHQLPTFHEQVTVCNTTWQDLDGNFSLQKRRKVFPCLEVLINHPQFLCINSHPTSMHRQDSHIWSNTPPTITQVESQELYTITTQLRFLTVWRILD